jgi:L,D-transpeptidase catalytic domain
MSKSPTAGHHAVTRADFDQPTGRTFIRRVWPFCREGQPIRVLGAVGTDGMASMARSRNLMSCFVDMKHKQTWLLPVRLATVSVAAVIASGDHMDAASRRNEPSVTAVESRTAGEPIMAIVSLRDQRITVYDKSGWILRATVSSGQKGRETPAGIFSVIQKEAEHYSNLYDDAYMPHMQRITWSGIALHGGPLPGHRRRMAASGCPTTLPNTCLRRPAWACA